MTLTAGFIIPHPPLAVPAVGRGEEHGIPGTIEGLRTIASRIAELEPETIVFTSPHTAYYADYIHISPGERADGSFAQFGAADAGSSITYDEEFTEHLREEGLAHGVLCGTVGAVTMEVDHGLLVPLHYIQQEYPTTAFDVVRIGGSAIDDEALHTFGRMIAETARDMDRSIVFIASGDLSHKLKADGPYGFHAAGPEFDEKVVGIIRSGDLDRFMDIDPELAEKAAECGLSGFKMLAGALSGTAHGAELHSYEGPFGVGYATASFIVED